MSIWIETEDGAAINTSWEHMLTVYLQQLPKHFSKLRSVANRPITG